MNTLSSSDNLHAPLRTWTPPPDWLRVTTFDLHTAGEPLRVITGGYPALEGETILEKRKFARDHADEIRTALMWEPRGHREMYGCVLTPARSRDADFGIIFLHNEGYSTMCGHGTIAIATAAVTAGIVPAREPETPVRIESPAGLITAYARVSGGVVTSVRFHNVPSFVLSLEDKIDVPGVGRITYDLAFGGAFYAYVSAAQVGLTCRPGELPRLVDLGMRIKRAIMQRRTIDHPIEKDLGFLYGTIFHAPPQGEADRRNVCIFAEGEVDRSPTGTGVSGRLAIDFARNELKVGQPMVVESIIGTTFTGRVVRATMFEKYQAIIPEIEGAAYITGRHEFWIDPSDPLRHGFFI